jgi:hypothetical protein
MKTRVLVSVLMVWSASAAWSWAGGPAPAPTVTGDYVEIRSCDVYTGPCFANGEMGLTGREAVLAWSVREGSWQGAKLDGLRVLAVVRADGTLGDVRRYRRSGKAVLIVDAKADPKQREALAGLAKRLAGPLLHEVVRVETAPIEIEVHPKSCPNDGCSHVRAEGLVEIQTRCLSGNDHVCGNEERFYPPLTTVDDSRPAFTVVGQFRGKGLGITFDEAGRRSAYLATFTQ